MIEYPCNTLRQFLGITGGTPMHGRVIHDTMEWGNICANDGTPSRHVLEEFKW